MVDLQVLNYVLNTKDISIITNNDFDTSYFTSCPNQFQIIMTHYETYGNVPDKVTLINNPYFSEDKFSFFDVSESKDYLIDALEEERKYVRIKNALVYADKLAANEDAGKAIDYLSEEIENIQSSLKSDAINIIAEAEERFKEYEDKSKNRNKYFTSTGFKELDDVLGGGWDRDDFILITARPGVGKSFITDFVLYSAMMTGKTPGLWSGEMSINQVASRVDTFMSHISNFKISRGFKEIHSEYREHINKMKQMKEKFFVITDKELGGIATPTRLRTFAKKNKLDILGADQISLMEDGRNTKNIVDRAYNISTSLKHVQTELRIPVLVVSQLNRKATEKDVNHGVEVIAQTDKLGQDATIVLVLEYRDECLYIKIIKARTTAAGTTLIYKWNIDKGEFVFIPTSEDKPERPESTELKTNTQFEDKRENVF